MKLKNTHKYDDIMHLSRPASEGRARMSGYDRAAQFSPFAALTGFDAAIEETGRLTDTRIEPEEYGLQLLDEQMRALLEVVHTRPKVRVEWFCRDERKDGGSYVTTTGHVKKVDDYCGQLIFTDGRCIPLGEIWEISLFLFRQEKGEKKPT